MERTHKYKITKAEAKAAWDILNGRGPMLARLKALKDIRTTNNRQIGQGFRNDIDMIIDAAPK